MGLSGRKTKQRIGADPRNLTWADDAAKFGQSYLSKFGWDSSKGLGVEGDGRKSHIKVDHKLDMLGIGAAHQKDPNGIAWKQNKDFENLLKRLNAGTDAATEGDDLPGKSAMDGFSAATADLGVPEAVVMEDNRSGRKAEKKRKRKEDEEGKDEAGRKKRKESKEEKKQGQVEHPEANPVVAEPTRPLVPRHRAHRARAIAAKSIASKSATAISEILGIAPTPSSSTPSGSATPQGVLTPCNDDGVSEKLTTSTKSVTDYFKEKLLAKAKVAGTTTQAGDGSYDTPRGLGSSRLRIGVTTETTDTETNKLGLSKFSSLMSSAFLSATTPILLVEPLASPEPITEMLEVDPTDTNKSRKRKKEGRKSRHDKGTQQEEPDSAKIIPTSVIAIPLDGHDAERKRAKEERKREKGERKRKRLLEDSC